MTGPELLKRLLAAPAWPDDTDVMEEIADAATGGLDVRATVPELIKRLDSPHEWSSAEAAKTLGAVGDAAAVDPLCRLAGFVPHELPDDLGPKPSETLYAHAVVAHDEAEVRFEAVRALGKIGDARALPALRACAAEEQEDREVRDAARASIATISGRG